MSTDNPADVAEWVLIRLAATTHGFDQGNARVPLAATSVNAESTFARVQVPNAYGEFDMRSVAPPGPYMLFALDEDGELLAEAAYVRLCDASSSDMQSGCGVDNIVCETSPGFSAVQTSCDTEPLAGVCPTGSESSTSLAPPEVDRADGSKTTGWRVVVPPEVVRDHTAPTASEVAAVEDYCAAACEAEWSDPSISAACADAGTFLAPSWDTTAQDEPHVAVDLIHKDHQQGAGLFPGPALGCDLGSTCDASFDEELAAAVPRRGTAASAPLERGEEYRLDLLVEKSKVVLRDKTGAQLGTLWLTGETGYSFCSAGNSSAPCPFYLGSLSVSKSGADPTIALQCDDGSTDSRRVEDLSISLVQPAWGIDEQSTQDKAFPPGALLMDISMILDGIPFSQRRANEGVVLLEERWKAPNHFKMTGDIEFENMSCGNGSTVDFSAELILEEDAGYVEEPPSVAITMPNKVMCNGQHEALLSNVSDPDGDLVESQWIVDGVLLTAGTLTMPFTQAHTLELRATDARGAVTTDSKVVSCLE